MERFKIHEQEAKAHAQTANKQAGRRLRMALATAGNQPSVLQESQVAD